MAHDENVWLAADPSTPRDQGGCGQRPACTVASAAWARARPREQRGPHDAGLARSRHFQKVPPYTNYTQMDVAIFGQSFKANLSYAT